MNYMKNMPDYGPQTRLSQEIDAQKYRQTGEDFYSKCVRIANALKDDDHHFDDFKDILREQRFLAAGRVQNAMGSTRETTAYNCFVSGQVPDSMDGIMQRAAEAAETMRRGGGIGYCFSQIRPVVTGLSRSTARRQVLSVLCRFLIQCVRPLHHQGTAGVHRWAFCALTTQTSSSSSQRSRTATS